MKKCIPLELLKKYKKGIKGLFEKEKINYKDYEYYIDNDLLEDSINVEIILKAYKVGINKTKIDFYGFIKNEKCCKNYITIRKVKNKYEIATNFLDNNPVLKEVKENVNNVFYMQFELEDDLELSFEWEESHYARPRAER